MRERILAGAVEALGNLPLSKLTMEDIARSAGIARQTIYKYFANRDEIVIALFIEQIDDIHRARLEALHAERQDPDQLTEMFLAQITMANEWILLDRTFDPRIAPRVAELVLSSKALAECNASLWKPILAEYADKGLLRRGLDLDRAVRWMTYQAVWLLSHPDALTRDPDEKRQYVHDFIVAALIRI